jgi:hypothetical protein
LTRREVFDNIKHRLLVKQESRERSRGPKDGPHDTGHDASRRITLFFEAFLFL